MWLPQWVLSVYWTAVVIPEGDPSVVGNHQHPLPPPLPPPLLSGATPPLPVVVMMVGGGFPVGASWGAARDSSSGSSTEAVKVQVTEGTGTRCSSRGTTASSFQPPGYVPAQVPVNQAPGLGTPTGGGGVETPVSTAVTDEENDFRPMLDERPKTITTPSPSELSNEIGNIYPLGGGPPADVGPQRPGGQFPPGVGPPYDVDLGPHRPHGQQPPPPDVEVRPLTRQPPAGLDLGPRRPAGQVDPNGPPGGDLGPQRPGGQFPPQPHGGPPGGDLGPQRPSGQAPPPPSVPVQDDDVSSFRVHWNVPSFMCHRYGLPFQNLSGRYGIVQNDEDVFRGEQIAILYDPGLYPALVENEEGKVMARNGGVPQEGDLSLHLDRLRTSIEDQVPADFRGLGVIDFEAWRPVWAQNFGSLRPYQNYSIELERARTPGAEEGALLARARRRFEAAAKEFFLASLRLAQEVRPHGRWGYYAFPYCFNGNSNNFDCSDNLRTQNSNIQWLFDASTALFPSVYLSRSGRDSHDEFLFIRGKLREAARVAKGRKIVYPYLWYRYRDSGYLSDDDLRSCLALPRSMGFPGAVVWGSSGDMNTKHKCQGLNAQLESRLGPTIRKFSVTLSDRRVREYVYQRAVSAAASNDAPAEANGAAADAVLEPIDD